MLFRFFVTIIFVLLLSFSRTIVGLRVRGQYSTDEFFRLITKFGIQKTDQHRPEQTFGYIYGNITLDCPNGNCSMSTNARFIILDYDYFMSMFNERSAHSCSRLMKRLETIAFDRQCNERGNEDFWRRIPCPKDQLCPDEDQPRNVIPQQQFTFKIRDINQPRFVSTRKHLNSEERISFLSFVHTDFGI